MNDDCNESASRLLSVRQVTKQLGLGRTSVYGLIATGKLRSVTIGRRRLIPCEALEEFLVRLSADRSGAL